MRSLIKVYPPDTLALDHVDLTIKEGEIHSLIGENGAGKSTLMKVLYGMIPASSGEISFRGRRVRYASPREAVAAGIGMVHQEFMLVPSYTIYENVILGAEPVGRLGALRNAEARRHVQSLVDRYGLNLSIDDRVRDTSVGAQQKVEILKLLYRDVDVLIMDEPTAVLTPQETGELFRRLRDLNAAGKTIIFISHKLDEVLELSDTITVMRRGRRVATWENRGLGKADLARAMVGRDVVFSVAKPAAHCGDVVFEARDLSYVDAGGRRRLDGVSLAVRRGEIVGIAGVEGNGQFELVQLVTGLTPIQSGQVKICGRDVTRVPVIERRKLMCYVPQDRKASGSAQKMSLADNAIMTHHRLNPRLESRWRALLSPRKCRRFAQNLVDTFGVLAPNVDTPISSLSGGNQQKVVVGREFLFDADFVLLDQPTRGVDVGSVEFIQREIIRKRGLAGTLAADVDANVVAGGSARGGTVAASAGCLLISADLDELFSLADRILVMHRGRIVADLAPPDTTREEVGEYMLGVRESQSQRQPRAHVASASAAAGEGACAK
ncbi:MAG: ABC transporter ATP-binding protein [Firmicutes bacterium]|nr:ABC transporter ATP-binding protein [Bacillota bacterium]